MRGALYALCVVACAASMAMPVRADTLVNINTADQATLETLNGIGPSKAQAIIDYRTQNGPFATIEDIMNVSGIGTATFNNIKAYITVGDGSTTSTGGTSTQPPAQTNTQSQSSQSSSYVAPPAPDLFVDAGADRTVIVGADTTFSARAYTKSGDVLDNVRFSWNFGDGATAEGQSVLHHYDFPGRYALVINIAQNKSAASDEVVVTAEAAKLAFLVFPDGSVEIDNLAERSLDLSGWIVRAMPNSASSFFILPEHTLILSASSIRLTKGTLGFQATVQSELDYPNGATAFRAGGAPPAAVVAPGVLDAPAADSVAHTEAKGDPTAFSAGADDAPQEEEDTSTSLETAAAAESTPTGNSRIWWAAAVALALAASGSLVAARRLGKKEWNITEE